ncbi:MAG TPA: TRAM domain-containing protein [Candidatus Nanoarchaeia archaeon]|nr:TRAM domain-containing protein [Candidatus Nanoarchaeia archaeon]
MESVDMYGNKFGGGDRERRSFAPVNVGQEIDVKIEAVGEKGDGIAKIKGFVIFVPNVKAGDEVKIKITKVLRKVGFGEVVGASSGPIDNEGSSDEGSQEEDGDEEKQNYGSAEEESSEEDSEEF